MKRVRKAVVVLMALCCLLVQMSLNVCADVVQKSSNMDVVLVIDVSGSMQKTDPNKVALEGAKLFIDMMENSGSRAGIVAFSDELVQVYNMTAINSEADKTSLKNVIDNLQFSGDTDIGTAIQKAVEMITTAQDVGNNKMILFFTDGKIDLPKASPSEEEAEKESYEKANSAISAATASDIPIYTIGLNVNGGVDTDLISNMSASTGAKNSIVTSAGELPPIFNSIFADFVESEIDELGDITIKDSDTYEELPFEIPNDSVLEANIVMITSGEGTLSDILLVRPDGSNLSPDGQTLLLSTSNNYNMLKLIGPMAGNWTLKIKGDQGCQVHVNLLFNYDVVLKASTQADADGNLHVSATLEKNGTPVQDEALYGQLTTNVSVTRSDGTVTSYPMTLTNTTFDCTVPVEEGETVQAYAHTEGANMYRDSEVFQYTNTVVTETEPPETEAPETEAPETEKPELTQQSLPSPIEISGLLPNMAKTKLNLADYFGSTDPAAIISYQVQVSDDSIASVQLENGELHIQGAVKGTTQLLVRATDDAGNALEQQTDVIVKATFGSILPLILIPVVLLLVILLVIILLANRPKPLVGYLYWQILQEDGITERTEEEQYDLTFAGKKAAVSEFVTDVTLSYAGLEKVEVIATKNGISVQNKGKVVLTDENGGETKKLAVLDGGSFKIECQTEDGDTEFVSIRYQRDMNDMLY